MRCGVCGGEVGRCDGWDHSYCVRADAIRAHEERGGYLLRSTTQERWVVADAAGEGERYDVAEEVLMSREDVDLAGARAILAALAPSYREVGQ